MGRREPCTLWIINRERGVYGRQAGQSLKLGKGQVQAAGGCGRGE